MSEKVNREWTIRKLWIEDTFSIRGPDTLDEEGHSVEVVVVPAACLTAAQAEIERLQGEVVNRNARALEGDQLRANVDAMHEAYERELAEANAQVKAVAKLYALEQDFREAAEKERDSALALLERAESKLGECGHDVLADEIAALLAKVRAGG